MWKYLVAERSRTSGAQVPTYLCSDVETRKAIEDALYFNFAESLK